MCGRYTIVSNSESVKKEFSLEETSPIQPQYNAAPSYALPVITDVYPQRLSFLRWGLIPNWAKDMKIGNKTINARSETILEKASFRKPIRKQRCLVLANCYFEWKKEADHSKVPHLIYCMNQRLFAMAGIWDNWVNQQSGEVISSFSIITVPAVPRLAELHERMPAILTKAQREAYLNPTTPIEEIIALLVPYENEQMNAMPVSNLVNSPANNTKEILQPIAPSLY
ncbi:MAG: SOS response-associated peptidase [Flammeovirgaceae bacterium]